jgi:hypothetical protein
MTCRGEILFPQWRKVFPNAIYILNGIRFAGLIGWRRRQEKPDGRSRAGVGTRKGKAMGRIIKALVVLVIFAFIGLTIYAYLGDLTPVQSEVKKPVVLNAD